MKSEKQSLEKLSEIIHNHAHDKQGMLYRNSFATACYLAINGKHEACNKLLLSLFDQLGWTKSKTYFLDIRESMPEFAGQYAMEINASSEVNSLFT